MSTRKKYILIVFSIFVIFGCWVLFFGGCVVPLSKEIDREELYGNRVDEQGNTTEQILKRKIRRNCYVILGPDGPGKHYWVYNQYLIKYDGHIIKELPHLYKFDRKDSYDIISPIMPIVGTNKWLAIKPVELKIHQVGDIDAIIFDKYKIHSRIRISDCRRLQPGAKMETFDIDYLQGNSIVIFHTANGDYLVDTNTGKLSKTDEKI